MSAINTMSRRSFVSTVASLVATGASFTMLPKVYAATGAEARPSLTQEGHHTDDEMKACIQLCRECHAMCTQTISHCLKLGGRHERQGSEQSPLSSPSSQVSLQKYSFRSRSQLHQQRQRQKGVRIHPGAELDHSHNDSGVERYLLLRP